MESMIMAKAFFDIDIPEAVLSDIFEIAHDGGIAYWAGSRAVRKESEDRERFVVDELVVQDREVEPVSHYHLSRADLVNGIALAISHGAFENGSDIVAELLDWDNCGGCLVDAGVADTFIQYAIFGGVVYG